MTRPKIKNNNPRAFPLAATISSHAPKSTIGHDSPSRVLCETEKRPQYLDQPIEDIQEPSTNDSDSDQPLSQTRWPMTQSSFAISSPAHDTSTYSVSDSDSDVPLRQKRHPMARSSVSMPNSTSDVIVSSEIDSDSDVPLSQKRWLIDRSLTRKPNQRFGEWFAKPESNSVPTADPIKKNTPQPSPMRRNKQVRFVDEQLVPPKSSIFNHPKVKAHVEKKTDLFNVRVSGTRRNEGSRSPDKGDI